MYRPLAFAAAATLLIALLDLPYGYYQFLRFGVCAVAGYGAVVAYTSKREGWAWILGGLAVLFNPFIPICFNREVWAALDVGAAILLLFSTRFIPARTS